MKLIYLFILTIICILSYISGFLVHFSIISKDISGYYPEIVPLSYVNYHITDNEALSLTSLIHTKSGLNLDKSLITDSVIVINLWATWCGPCIREMPSLDSLNIRLGGKAHFIIVSNEPVETINAFRQKFPYKFSLTFYSSHDIDSLPAFMNRGSIPYTYIIKKGVIQLQERGSKNWNTDEAYDFIMAF